MAKVTINQAPIANTITGDEKIPIGDSDNIPKVITTNQLKDYNSTPIITPDNTTYSIEPNIFYAWGEVEQLDITLVNPKNESVYNEYMFEFVSGATPTSLILPNNILWVQEPTIQENRIYQCSIVNNLAIIIEACVGELV